MKLYRLFWTEEGFMWRRGSAQIQKPKSTDKVKRWRVRIIGGKPGKALELTEGDYFTERKAFRAGNRLFRKLRRK
jgi:hypothetical protein